MQYHERLRHTLYIDLINTGLVKLFSSLFSYNTNNCCKTLECLMANIELDTFLRRQLFLLLLFAQRKQTSKVKKRKHNRMIAHEPSCSLRINCSSTDVNHKS